MLRSKAMYYWKPFNRRRLMRHYGQFVKPGALCFDVGAHLGNRSDAWLGLEAQVVAVEPQPACIKYLENRFGDHNRFTLVKKAIAAQAGTAHLQVSLLTPTITTLADEGWRQKMQDATSFHVQWDQQVAVETLTLDQLIATHGLPQFCKIDVEDFEVEALKGLSQPIPTISIEYFIPTLERAYSCLDLIDALGPYKYNWSFGESQHFQSETWLSGPE
ncbi:MAG: FkbM family methyltransferase, partial [Bacteroidota bacterium]